MKNTNIFLAILDYSQVTNLHEYTQINKLYL